MQILWLSVAALFEVGGDAAIRVGLRGRAWGYLFGALLLFLYGVLVNQPRLAFGRLLGLYIVVFFLMSQLLAFAIFSERPHWSLVVGGALIIAGGLVLHFGQYTP